MAKKAIWLSYDLGINGPYEELYFWLDSKGARECGDSIAFLNFESKTTNLVDEVKKSIQKSVNFRKRDRLYMIYIKDGKIKGTFLFGKRKSAPWKGSAFEGEDTVDE